MSTVSESLTLAVGYHQAGQLEAAEQLYREILRTNPHHAGALHLLGVMAYQCGRHPEAVERIRRAIASNPNAAAFHCNLGSAYKALGRLSEAAASCRRALELKPDFVDAYNNLGNVLREQGHLEEAERSYRSALRLKPNWAGVWNNLGLALLEQGKLDEAQQSIERALELDPGYAEGHNNLGTVLQRRGRYEEAAARFEQAVRLKPDYAQAHNNLGTALLEQQELGRAVASFERALEIKPDHVDALAHLAGLHERLNRLEEATALVRRGLRLSPDHPPMNLVAAKCEEREGRCREAIDRLERLRPLVQENPGAVKELSFRLGRLYDRAGEAGRAFDEFTKANHLARQAAHPCAANAQRYLEQIDVLTRMLKQGWPTSAPAAPALGEDQTPVFVIGFLRSGTTLLDVALDNHPRLQTVEEKPTMLAVQQEIECLPGGYPRAMRDLTTADIERLRATYFRRVGQFVDRRAGQILVDKYPMNTVHVGLILRLFPAARFIVAVRHPCDVCLSCFMQDFKIDHTKANFFFSVEETSLLYAKVMSLWRRYVRVLPHPHHVVRYEDLVDDFEGEMRRLLEFVNVEWDDAVLGYADHARGRGRISTPSYGQVTEPIYRRARYRWRRYAEQLEPVMGRLRPYIEYFGYGSPDDCREGRAT